MAAGDAGDNAGLQPQRNIADPARGPISIPQPQMLSGDPAAVLARQLAQE